MLGEGVANVESGGGGWRKRFNYTRESDKLMDSDMLMTREMGRLSEAEAAALLEEKEQDLILAAELGKTPIASSDIYTITQMGGIFSFV